MDGPRFVPPVIQWASRAFLERAEEGLLGSFGVVGHFLFVCGEWPWSFVLLMGSCGTCCVCGIIVSSLWAQGLWECSVIPAGFDENGHHRCSITLFSGCARDIDPTKAAGVGLNKTWDDFEANMVYSCQSLRHGASHASSVELGCALCRCAYSSMKVINILYLSNWAAARYYTQDQALSSHPQVSTYCLPPFITAKGVTSHSHK